MKIRDFFVVYYIAMAGLAVSYVYGGKVVWDKNGVPHIEQQDNIKGCYQSLDKNTTKKSCDEK